MSLINKILKATETGHLQQPFTVEELKDWMEKESIVKDDGNKYAQSSINAILSNSDKKNSPTSNKNRKVLQSRMIRGGIYEYWF